MKDLCIVIQRFFPKYYQKSLLKKPNLSKPLIDYLSTPLISQNTLIEEIEFLVLDFETTGLNASKEKIISIGYTVIKNLHLLASSSRHLLVNPKQLLKEENVSIHQLTDDNLQQGVSLQNAMDELFSVMRNRVVVVHFDKIEKNFINHACHHLYQINRLPMIMLDTLQIEARKMSRFQGYIQGDNLRLFTLRNKYNLPRYKAHNAMQDAIATAELFLAQVDYMGEVKSIKLHQV
ncbi:DEDDh 3'-5' exonuclease domain of the epsilon subunit of DNA polymerase III [Bathymodiolus heckerae thiotrophic gill symbiont]|uniref:exonuclease domain-containing protein n=1 Tax=Bathymodiolus heckerae thiotrophic gill symbiont TaxID=1052212 RepID=UPI0010B8EA19|nr:exonuclease domain-containing protein [Bathymodiolus heckerae thiotrophic gill symbiont]SMN13943.1 DEDDh 3'-5' exonuclease domain of the epsilon subunit of DNA polymerase III [Bathymodiolus heckerae thiotrophic gill symbiont]